MWNKEDVDNEIAEIAKKYGAKVPFMRSEKNADDYATTDDVVLEVLAQYKEMGQVFDYACCIYPTAPFITAKRLQEAMKLMDKYNPVVVMPMVAFSFPPQRCHIIDENGYASYKYPEYMLSRSQDLEKQYHEVGQFYLYHAEKFIQRNGRVFDGIMPIIVSELEVQDIDNEEDWKIAELKFRLMNE